MSIDNYGAYSPDSEYAPVDQDYSIPVGHGSVDQALPYQTVDEIPTGCQECEHWQRQYAAAVERLTAEMERLGVGAGYMCVAL